MITAYTPSGQHDLPFVISSSLISGSGRETVRSDPKIVELAAKYIVTPTQLILGWHLARGVPIITKSTNVKRQKENLKVQCSFFELVY